ncbi:hypothetical protein DSL72_007528 [Monilinia vaccinii-corymbosi]|uniref:Uncharacterized protein n=1 Tax=Monilinia vaccinii-corymbosi TaxID=61207 RepID=A0A8A3PI31_9HELO|nr:hypothetical protein DSL72_007528 [Monilinia vaccinii-corymbosi]
MVDISPFSTPTTTPTATSETTLKPPTANTSPWSDISMENWRNGVDFRSPPPAYNEEALPETHQRFYKAKLESLHKAIWLTVLIMICFWFWLRQQQQQQQHIHFYQYDTKILTTEPALDGLQFINASHPYIRYVGRWSSTLDGMRKDGSFPGIYLDIAFNGSSTIVLSLHNSDRQAHEKRTFSQNKTTRSGIPPSLDNTSAEPISLLAQVDDEEYVILPNATSLVAIRTRNLDPQSQHVIRVIAPMVGRDTVETFQFLGVWIDEVGQLIPVPNPISTKKPQLSARGIKSEDFDGFRNDLPRKVTPQRKMLEIITDLPGSMTGRDRRKHRIAPNFANGILGGVMGWEYLTGEMFGSDHVTIGMDGMCLVQECIGGRGSPTGLADVFFQSGPLGSEQYAQPWLFQSYTPEVMILNIGNADWESFRMHDEEYNLTTWELSVRFEETYVSLIKAIRILAYPRYSSTMAEAAQYDYPQRRAVDIPIFVMRPFRGQLEQATHSVVDRLQFEGDKSVFWLDTSGWLNTNIDFEGRPEDQDFFLDEESTRKEWRLTERGNQRVAILLHMHVCRYLAQEADKCAFLAPEVYQGATIDPVAMHFDEYMRDEKERRLKKLFWVSPEDE